MAEGRRARVKEKVQRVGIDALSDHEVIEAYLYAFEKRKDTAEIGRKLIKHFGSLKKVFNASLDELLSLSYLPKLAALYITQHQQLCKRSSESCRSSLDMLYNQNLEEMVKTVRLGCQTSDQVVLLLYDCNLAFICCAFMPHDVSIADTIKRGFKVYAKYYVVGKSLEGKNINPSKLMDYIIELNSCASSLGGVIYDYIFVKEDKTASVVEALGGVGLEHLNDENKLSVFDKIMEKLCQVD